MTSGFTAQAAMAVNVTTSTTYYIEIIQFRTCADLTRPPCAPGFQTRSGGGTGGTLDFHISNDAKIDVNIIAILKGSYDLPEGGSTRQAYSGVTNGPVRIASTNSTNVIAAERVIYAPYGSSVSFSELMGLPASQLDTTYWLPWYNNVGLDTQLRIGNVSGSTATVNVYIHGSLMAGSPFTLAAGQSTQVSYAGQNDGPVQIVSDIPIVAAERVIYAPYGSSVSFSELMGLPASLLNTTYWLPWYNNVGLDTQLRFGFP